MQCITDANIWIDLNAGGVLGPIFDLGLTLRIPDLVFAELLTPNTERIEDSIRQASHGQFRADRRPISRVVAALRTEKPEPEAQGIGR